jgi:hypothetical protein
MSEARVVKTAGRLKNRLEKITSSNFNKAESRFNEKDKIDAISEQQTPGC